MEVFKSILTMLIAVVLVLGLICGTTFIVASCRNEDIEKWSNGFCQCGNKWEFINGSHSNYKGERYYYHCDNCGNVIDIKPSVTKE